jgi:hypothetical protein
MKVSSHNQLARTLNIIVKAKNHNTPCTIIYCKLIVMNQIRKGWGTGNTYPQKSSSVEKVWMDRMELLVLHRNVRDDCSYMVDSI